jgi:hypothetical protein
MFKRTQTILGPRFARMVGSKLRDARSSRQRMVRRHGLGTQTKGQEYRKRSHAPDSWMMGSKLVHPVGIEPTSAVPETAVLSVELWVLISLFSASCPGSLIQAHITMASEGILVAWKSRLKRDW